MTEREYRKYNRDNVFDALGKPIKVGDTVVISNHYGSTPYIGKVDHFTESGTLAIHYLLKWRGKNIKCRAYRLPENVIKIRSGNKSNSKNKG